MKERPWWQDAVIYHIYPRSFRDSTGDGVGDLPGIVEKLDHLAWLGVNALWMGPVFRSPQVDNGYDISDYRDIDPLFGSLADLDHLVAEAHRLGIRVLLDLVLNHSSTEHPWFRASRDNPRGEYSDFYHWADPAPNGGFPNNWRSFFSIPAWTWSAERGQYYINLFAVEQADLNWTNPRVRHEMAAIANYWLDRDVDGFRMDVINLISKAPGYPSIPPGGNPRGYYIDGPEALGWIREFRSRLRGTDDVLLVGETIGTTPPTSRRWTAAESRALHMVISFEHVNIDYGPGGRWDYRPFRSADLAGIVATQQQALAGSSWPCLYSGNHDQPRAVSRFGNDGAFRRESAVAVAALFLLLRGTPIIYQGEEIAMANYPFTAPDQFEDVKSINAIGELTAEGAEAGDAFARVKAQARDNARTPMQWDATETAGFTSDGVAPWFPVNPDYPEWNVERQRELAEQGEPSVLGVYRQLIALRRDHTVFRTGACEVLDLGEDSPAIAFRRYAADARGGGAMLVVINFSSVISPLPSPAKLGLGSLDKQPVFATHPKTDSGTLQPWEVSVFRMAAGY